LSARKVLLGVSGSWLLTFTRVASGLVTTRLYFHFLDPKLLGAWMLFLSMSGFLLVTDLGMAMVFSRELAFSVGKKKGPVGLGLEPGDLYASINRIYWALGAAVFVAGGALGCWYLGSLGLGDALASARLAWLVYALGACLVLAASTPNYALQGLGDLGIEALANVVATLGALGATLLALELGGGMLSMACIFLAQAGITRLSLSWLLRRRHAWLFQKPGRYKKGALQLVLKETLPLFATRLGALFVFQINPMLIASAMGVEALPNYAVLVTLASYGIQICLALPQSLMPFVSAKQSAGDTEGIRRLLLLCVKSGMAMALAYAIGVALWAGPLLELWLGPGHDLGFGVLGFLLLSALLEFHHSIHALFSFSMGDWPFAKSALAAGVLNVGLVFLGLKIFGLPGAAAGSMAAQLATNNWYVVAFTLKNMGLKFHRYAGAALLPLGLLALALAAFGAGLKALHCGPVLGGLSLAALAAFLGWRALLSLPERLLFSSRWMKK
jgi:O-antigen/teichoic acid export membrane protein